MNNCPECGTPLDDIPFKRCKFHEAHRIDEENALQAKLAARPMSEKIEQSEDFEELRRHLVDYFRDLELQEELRDAL